MSGQTLREELAGIFGALAIHSATAFSFRGGAPFSVPAAGPASGLGPLIEALRNLLYGHCYVRPREATPSPWSAQGLLPLLVQANPTVDRWDPGWTIYQLTPDGRIQVQKGERSRSALSGEYASNKAPGLPLQTGDTVNLRVHPGSADLQTAFYFVFGDTLSDQFDEYNLLRFYFNLTADTAPDLLREVAARCNRYQVPFRYKTLADPAAYVRADGAVLYCARRYFGIVAELLDGLPESIASRLRAETPLFTRTLRPGIGVAEEPGTGESFGMHRCRLVAEGLADAWTLGAETPESRLAAVERRFAANGLSLDRPYLNGGSADPFDTLAPTGGLAP